jgi:hypothetical protein
VKSWNTVTGKLEIFNPTKEFIIGETITGSTSSATYQLKSSQEFNTVNAYPQNNEIESEGDAILDFTESNPFGNP